jgi:uncharacterized protein with HEPN domain
MSKRGDIEFLSDIKEAIKRVENYTKGISYSSFKKNTKTQDAVVRNIEIIGEAVKSISENIKKESQLIPWKKLAGMRDRLIHSYFGVNYDIIWAAAKKDLKEISSEIDNLLQRLRGNKNK